jgi:hypothetical protein
VGLCQLACIVLVAANEAEKATNLFAYRRLLVVIAGRFLNSQNGTKVMLDLIKSGKLYRPRRTLVYGGSGIGKSTFAACFPHSIFIQTEDGAGDIEVDKFPLAESVSDVYKQLQTLIVEDHKYKSLTLDSADWFEHMIWDSLVTEANANGGSIDTIVDFGWGKGFAKAVTVLDGFLKMFDILRDSKGMEVVIVAHSEIKKFQNPAGESYDRYLPSMHPTFTARIAEWCDEVLFCDRKKFTKSIDEGFKKKRSVGVGGDERTIYTQERPTFFAKNRIQGLPAEIPLSYAEYQKYLSKPTEKKE